MTIKVLVTFMHTDGGITVHMDDGYAAVHGRDVPFADLTVEDLTSRVSEAEAYLSRITGLTVKIETESADRGDEDCQEEQDAPSHVQYPDWPPTNRSIITQTTRKF